MSHSGALPGVSAASSLESVIIAATVFKGHAQGRPFTLTKLAHYLAMPRTTVRNNPKPLIAGGTVERQHDGTYVMCEPRANSDAVLTKVHRIIAALRVVSALAFVW
jgi:DNA-binding IclR family transcriptional regulator